MKRRAPLRAVSLVSGSVFALALALVILAQFFGVRVGIFIPLAQQLSSIPTLEGLGALAVLAAFSGAAYAASRRHGDEIDAMLEEAHALRVPTGREADRIIERTLRVRAKARGVAKVALLALSAYVAFYILSTPYALVDWGYAILSWLFFFIELNRLAFPFMAMVYAAIAFVLMLVYFLPYRYARKELLVIGEGHGQDKALGRVVSIRGVSTDDRPPSTFAYSVWYAARRLAGDRRPNPHAMPAGDPYYLKAKDSKGEPFNWCVTYEPNTRGVLRRRLPWGLRRLYGRGSLVVTPFTVRTSGDGFILRPHERVAPEAPAYDVLSRDRLTFHDRDEVPYKDQVKTSLQFAGGIVGRAVKGDPELGKKAIERFQVPGPLKVLAGLEAEISRAVSNGGDDAGAQGGK